MYACTKYMITKYMITKYLVTRCMVTTRASSIGTYIHHRALISGTIHPVLN